MEAEGTRKEAEGPVIPIMLALLCAGIAAVVFIVEPAHREYSATHGDENKLRREIAHEEEERSRLEVLARGLAEDPRVIERVQRNNGLAKPGEIRYIRPADTRPAK
jgi:hypothetical protein